MDQDPRGPGESVAPAGRDDGEGRHSRPETAPSAVGSDPSLLRSASPHLRSAPTAPLAGSDPRQVGAYRLVARVGTGGMGTVYLGIAEGGQRVAVKLVHKHLAEYPEFRARFAAEAEAGRRVPAFCSARVLDAGDHEGQPYLVAEYIDGVPLSQLVATEGPLDLPSLHALALGSAASLAAIHGIGLVHRDMKPSNVIMTLGGVRIIDFGIARALEETTGYTRTGIVMGSLGWAAPEQLEGEEPSPAMDIFGLGCILAFAATNRHPFGPGGLNTRALHVLNSRPNLDGVPQPLRSLVDAMLQRDPEDRPTAQELLLALVGAPTAAARSARRPAGRSRPRRKATAFAAAVPLALALVIGAAGAANLNSTGNGLVPHQPDRSHPASGTPRAPGSPLQNGEGGGSPAPNQPGTIGDDPSAGQLLPNGQQQPGAAVSATTTSPAPALTLPNGKTKNPKAVKSTDPATESAVPDPSAT